MKVIFLSHPFEHIIFEDVYDEKEYSDIVNELEWLVTSNSFDSVNELEKSGAAYDLVTKKAISNKRCLFLDVCYREDKRSLSKILTHNRKLIDLNGYEEETLKSIGESTIFKLYLKITNHDTTLVNFYQGGEDYRSHSDNTVFTCLWFHWKNRDSFKGGNLIFPEYNYAFECKNNTAIMFPGPVKHAVQKLLQIDYDILETDGRYSITQFLSVKI